MRSNAISVIFAGNSSEITIQVCDLLRKSLDSLDMIKTETEQNWNDGIDTINGLLPDSLTDVESDRLETLEPVPILPRQLGPHARLPAQGDRVKRQSRRKSRKRSGWGN